MVRVARTDVASGKRLGERQREFAAALLDAATPVPAGIISPDGTPCTAGFNVYRNNVVAGLVEVLKAAYPAVYRIVGDTFFSAMACGYVMQAPPCSPVMLEYGVTFPDFVDMFGPAACVPYLRDVARLERAWVEAYHAADTLPTDLTRLATLDASALPSVRLLLHPSLRVVRSAYPVVTLWQMNVADGTPVAIDPTQGDESALVTRCAADVEVRTIPAGAASFIQSLASGASVAKAASLAFSERADFDLEGTLSGLLALNVVIDWELRDAV